MRMPPRARMQLLRARQALLLDTANAERKKREYLERQNQRRAKGPQEGGGYPPGWNLPYAATIEGWHVDEHGCRARSVGSP